MDSRKTWQTETDCCLQITIISDWEPSSVPGLLSPFGMKGCDLCDFSHSALVSEMSTRRATTPKGHCLPSDQGPL